jgi:nitroimidazol reductase NimA-like FMN-containing flavoprotein (pyridoxamine 5'-phosphate oxidase superfamily)
MIPDEPLLGTEIEESGSTNDEPLGLEERIRRLLSTEPFAVLCTQGQGQPYGSVVAFAANADLASLAFSTSISTRKFRLLTEGDRIAMVVDNRPRYIEDMMQVEAVTITGRARLLPRGGERALWASHLLDRHAYLKSFIASPSTALFRVDIVRYFYVTRFQEVYQWIPSDPGA